MPEPRRDRRALTRKPELAAFDLAELATPSAIHAAVVREARRGAGLSTAELAERIGVPTQVVELWEDPLWEGHSLNLLRRVARAVGSRLELRIAPVRQRVSEREGVSAA